MKKKLSKNKKGSIEGLPLQLMIIILVATMGTAIIIGWMGNIDTPESIGDVEVVSGDIVLDGNTTTDGFVDVYVYDQDGNPIEDATIVLSGLGVTDANGNTAHSNTDNKGHATFENLNITLRGANVGFITLNVSSPDHGDDNSTRIMVIS